MRTGRCVAICMAAILTIGTGAASLEPIGLSEDGSEFVKTESGERFFAWGFNYDRDHKRRLIEDYWHEEWDKVAEDFQSMKELGANLVRVHLQFGQFMPEPGEFNQDSVIVPESEDIEDYKDALRKIGIYLKPAVKA